MERDDESRPGATERRLERRGVNRPQALAILRERARELARAIAPPETGERLDVVEFRLGRERLAFESAWVKEVFTPPAIVPVPGTPPFVTGVVNLRGRIVSVIDLRQVLALAGGEEERSVVLLLAGADMEFGVLAARVEGARHYLRRQLAPPLTTLPDAAREFQRGVFPGAVALLDARLLLTAPQLRVDQRERTNL